MVNWHWRVRQRQRGPLAQKGSNMWLSTKIRSLECSKLISKEEKKWDEHTLRLLFDEGIVEEILSIPLSPFLNNDRLVWTKQKSGNYTVKSAYNSIRALEAKQPTDVASTSF